MNALARPWLVVLAALCAAHCAGSHAGGGDGDVVRARKVEIVDRAGRVRATLGCDDDGVAMKMLDSGGRPAVSVSVKTGTPRDRALVTLYGEDGRATAVLGYPEFQFADASDVLWGDRRPTLTFLDDSESIVWHAPPQVVAPDRTMKYVH